MAKRAHLLPLRIYGDAILRLKARPVDVIDDALLDFARNLQHTMYLRDGVGLAAPQVGESIRLIVIDPFWAREGHSKEPLFMLNPEVLESSGESDNEEGCISIPGIFAFVTRPAAITVSFTDLQGESRTARLEGFPAIVAQHEMDHLDGVLFTDRVNTITKLKLKRRLKDLERTTVDGENIRLALDKPAK